MYTIYSHRIDVSHFHPHLHYNLKFPIKKKCLYSINYNFKQKIPYELFFHQIFIYVTEIVCVNQSSSTQSPTSSLKSTPL